jgi:hypothetical protein
MYEAEQDSQELAPGARLLDQLRGEGQCLFGATEHEESEDNQECARICLLAVDEAPSRTCARARC